MALGLDRLVDCEAGKTQLGGGAQFRLRAYLRLKLWGNFALTKVLFLI